MPRDPRGVAFIHQQFGPYHVARARALEQRFAGRACFIQLASREALREWQLRGPAPELMTVAQGSLEEISVARLCEGLTSTLADVCPAAVVIAGYAHPAMRAAARWCRRNGVAAILLSDSHRHDRTRFRLKEWAKRAWIRRHFDGVFTAGAASMAYARELGFDASEIWRGYDVVDNDYFAAEASRAVGDAPRLRHELGLPEKFFLYVGRFSPEKNLPMLLDAMAAYRRRAGAGAWGLLLVGSGPEGPALERRASEMQGFVAITGFKQIDLLPQIYAAASALVLPSISEPWGLVINEAMACGLPILASERAGAAVDLVFPGINGYVFDPANQRDLVECMLRLSSDRVDLAAMGNASRRLIAGFTLETWATALIDCIDVTLGRRAAG
jgi:1,2-diacylglycerol 3-alpha-glucosyltransferase